MVELGNIGCGGVREYQVWLHYVNIVTTSFHTCSNMRRMRERGREGEGREGEGRERGGRERGEGGREREEGGREREEGGRGERWKGRRGKNEDRNEREVMREKTAGELERKRTKEWNREGPLL